MKVKTKTIKNLKNEIIKDGMSTDFTGSVTINWKTKKVLASVLDRVNDGSFEWVNDFDFNIGKRIPFTKADGTAQTLALVNSKDMTTVNGFLDHTVVQSYYVPFVNASEQTVTTLRPGQHAVVLETG